MKKIVRSVSFLILILCLSILAWSQDSVEEPEPLTLEVVNGWLSEINQANCEKAIEGYKKLLAEDPDNYEILYRLANAYIYILDMKTSAMIEERDEWKPSLKELGKIANDYAKKATEINAGGKEALGAELVSYGYYSASFGIVKAILKGAAGHYKDLCKKLIAIDDTYLGALGYRMMGKLYLEAPWPVGSKSKSLKYYQKAVETDGSILNAHYYVGYLHFLKKRYDLAEKSFKFVVDNPPNPIEIHYTPMHKKKAAEFLQTIAAKQNRN